MPQDSVVYAVARTRVLEARLLTDERLKRLLDAPDYETVWRSISEAGYGEVDASAYERAINNQMAGVCAYIREVSPNINATDVFLLKYDCHNAKVFFKAKMLHGEKANLSPCGTADAEYMMDHLEERNFHCLTKHMGEAAIKIDGAIESGTADAQEIDLLFDDACFADMLDMAVSSKESTVVEYVSALADLKNTSTLLRIKRAGLGQDAVSKAMLSGGNIAKNLFTEAYSIADDSVYKYIGLGRYADVVVPGIEAFIAKGSLSTLERLTDDYLLNIFRKRRMESFSIEPLIGYLLAKERETQALRLLIVAKLNSVPFDMIMERLREQYAQ